MDWNSSLSGDYLWSNTNFGEAVTRVMTPLTWSVVQYTLADWVFLPGFSTVGNIAGRPYLNISIFATVYRLMGRSQEDLLAYMESTLYMQLPAETKIPLIPVPFGQLPGVMAALARLRLRQARGLHRLNAYLQETPGWFKRMRQQFAQLQTPKALLQLWREDIRRHILNGRWTVLGTATDSADYTLNLHRRLVPLVGEEDAWILIGNLSSELELPANLTPLAALEEVAQGTLSRAAYLERYGHRGPDEFELSLPRPAEDPSWLDQQILQVRSSPSDILGKIARQRAAYMAAFERLAACCPSQVEQIKRSLHESARRGQRREQARSEYVRDRWLLRLFALRAADLCGLGGEVFFLRFDELLDLLDGTDTALALIDQRRETYERYRTLPAPPALILGRFDPIAWAADTQRRTDFFDARQQARAAVSTSKYIYGSPGSAGVVEARVRLLAKASQADQFVEGEVLVTSMTDISWTPLFPRAAAVITDVGAPLSHAAIVARELGIPAVVGCGDATLRLRTGDQVRVDGGRGVVEVLAE